GTSTTFQSPPKVYRLLLQGLRFLVATLLSPEDGQVVQRSGNRRVLVAVDGFPDAQRFLDGRQRVGEPAALVRRVPHFLEILGHLLVQVAVRTPMLLEGRPREAV